MSPERDRPDESGSGHGSGSGSERGKDHDGDHSKLGRKGGGSGWGSDKGQGDDFDRKTKLEGPKTMTRSGGDRGSGPDPPPGKPKDPKLPPQSRENELEKKLGEMKKLTEPLARGR